jgi:hypothetical protein
LIGAEVEAALKDKRVIAAESDKHIARRLEQLKDFLSSETTSS